ncbi:endonuclease MutS2 [Marinicrinis sediminis]|uniref:Endonuclease MutS2 n=1 Tax=Marinicrinis sediminis TaxID=1652465 RepID=A0ABW5RA48_9BACL
MNEKILKTLDFPQILERLQAYAATSLGKEEASQLRPSTDIQDVQHRLQAVYEALQVIRLKGIAPFGGITTVSPSLKRARIGGMLNSTELIDIATTIYGARRCKQHLMATTEEQDIPILVHLAEQVNDEKALEQLIKSCIDDHGEVMDQASPELQRIRRERRGGEGRIREKLDQMIKSPNTLKKLQDGIVTIRNDRYVLPVKQEYRGDFGGIVHDQSASGATLFIEPEVVVTLNNKLRELKLQEEREIEKILRQLTAQVAEEADFLQLNEDMMRQLDFIFAKAAYGLAERGSIPKVNSEGYIRLKRARHPLIGKEDVVPLHLELGESYSSIIVTGPNTGGKTVSLKTVGLLTLMGMSGLLIPAEEGSELAVFDGVFADIGDEQSIEQSLSTFSSHMTNIIRVLKDMTSNSLILLDEVGAGTDPTEGSALAISILEYIHRTGCRLIATTHYSELKAYAYNREGVINASMEFDVHTLSPTYRLLVGIPGRSNAFAIAERLGLDHGIIEHARSQLNEDSQQVESMIASLEENRISAESERLTAEQLRGEMELLREQMEREQEKLEQEKHKVLEKAQLEARETIAKARQEAEKIISELRTLAMEERTSIKEHKLIEAKTRLNQAEPALASAPAKKRKNTDRVGPGDEVYVHSFGQRGHIVELSGKSEAYVQLGIMKMKVKLKDLEKIKGAPASSSRPPQPSAMVKRSKDEHVRSECDLRGTTLDEAIVEVDQFLDDSLMANLNQVYIIHGKGTGVLRSGISDFLKKHRHVKGYRLGNYGEGGTGVTVVELK